MRITVKLSFHLPHSVIEFMTFEMEKQQSRGYALSGFRSSCINIASGGRTHDTIPFSHDNSSHDKFD